MGVANVVALFPALKEGTWERRVAELAGRPVERLRSEWIRRIGLPAS
jgi:hypothetical protein